MTRSAKALALLTPAKVAYNHKATRMRGSMAGLPAVCPRARMRSYRAERSSPKAKRQTARAGWSGSRRSSMVMGERSRWRSAVRSRGGRERSGPGLAVAVAWRASRAAAAGSAIVVPARLPRVAGLTSLTSRGVRLGIAISSSAPLLSFYARRFFLMLSGHSQPTSNGWKSTGPDRTEPGQTGPEPDSGEGSTRMRTGRDGRNRSGAGQEDGPDFVTRRYEVGRGGARPDETPALAAGLSRPREALQ